MRYAILMVLVGLCTLGTVFGQTTEFTYQGKLTDTTALSTTYDLEFRLCASAANCSSPLSVIQKPGVPVTDGVFTVTLDFGLLSGGDHWLEIAVKRPSETVFTTLSPSQKITSVPYSGHSVTSNNALNLGGLAAGQYVLTDDPRLDGGNYVRNSTTPQVGVNFNVGGTGTAGILNAATQFNLGGQKILSNAGTRNLFAGINSGNVNTGNDNSFFGYNSGQSNTTGNNNSFFGSWAGNKNTSGQANSFFGTNAGGDNTSGSLNSFFGSAAGLSNTVGERNSFFGEGAGVLNTIGSNNSFFGSASGFNNRGSGNTFIGTRAGTNNFIGASNTFVGTGAGQSNSEGNLNTFVGTEAGASNTTAGSNSFFGFRAGFSNTTGFANSFFGWNAGFNNTANQNSFFGYGTGRSNTTGTQNSFFGQGAGEFNTAGEKNVFVGQATGASNTTGLGNTFIGQAAGSLNTSGSLNIFIGLDAGNPNLETQVSNSIAIGRNAKVTANNSIVIGNDSTVSNSNTILLGRTNQRTFIPGNFRVQDNGSGAFLLDTVSISEGRGLYSERLYFGSFSSLFSPRHVCSLVPAGIAANGLNLCSSPFASASLKSNIQSFADGLEVVKRLRPVSFTWNVNGERDYGLLAEDVAAVAPDLAVQNAQGVLNDISEGGVTVLLINAIQEQQKQIEAQQKQIKELRQIVCAIKADSPGCQE